MIRADCVRIMKFNLQKYKYMKYFFQNITDGSNFVKTFIIYSYLAGS